MTELIQTHGILRSLLFINNMKLIPDTISCWHDGCGSMMDVGITDSSLSPPEGCQHSGWHSQTLPCGAINGSWLCWAATDGWTDSHTTPCLVKKTHHLLLDSSMQHLRCAWLLQQQWGRRLNFVFAKRLQSILSWEGAPTEQEIPTLAAKNQL